MTRTDKDRTALLDRLAAHVMAHGLGASSLRPLAKAAGTSDRMLMYYFGDKAGMMTAIIGHIGARLVALLEKKRAPNPLPLARLERELATILFDAKLWPYMRIWLEIASLAAQGDAFYRQTGEAMGRFFLAWGEGQIAARTPSARARDAARLLVTMEGMLFLKAIGLEDVSKAAGAPK
ncbi:MAG TPA: TetR/AcrR family transcriptional regulator [Micropepsaceae bacterium]|nr:TetR/AcrR family transcriptional regulator [Micropepsaceae bacterium]